MNSRQNKDLENRFPFCREEKPVYCHLNLPQPFLYEQYLEHLRQDHEVPTIEGESGYVALNIRQGTDKAVQHHALAMFKAFSKEFLVMALECQKEIKFYTVLLARPEKDFIFTSAFYFFLPYGNPKKSKIKLSKSSEAKQLVKEFDAGMTFKERKEIHQLNQKDLEAQINFFGPFKGGTDKVLSMQDSFHIMFESENFFSVEKQEVEQYAVCDGLYKMWIQLEKVPNNPIQTIQRQCNKVPFQPNKDDEEKLEWRRNEKDEYILEKQSKLPVPTKEVVEKYEILKADKKKQNYKYSGAQQISSGFFSSFS